MMSTQPYRFHLALKATSSRFDEIVGFYTQLFGGEPVKLKPGYAKFEPREPWVNFTLNAVDQVTAGDLDHLGIQVWNEEMLMAARERMIGAGLEVRDETEVACCYAEQNKFWVTDPDGRQIEFFRVLKDIQEHGRLKKLPVAVGQDEAAPCCAPGCCAAPNVSQPG
jgi:catechol 2,3-dioxygenase-like lactoylglutathione lyase family enzyme